MHHTQYEEDEFKCQSSHTTTEKLQFLIVLEDSVLKINIIVRYPLLASSFIDWKLFLSVMPNFHLFPFAHLSN